MSCGKGWSVNNSTHTSIVITALIIFEEIINLMKVFLQKRLSKNWPTKLSCVTLSGIFVLFEMEAENIVMVVREKSNFFFSEILCVNNIFFRRNLNIFLLFKLCETKFVKYMVYCKIK